MGRFWTFAEKENPMMINSFPTPEIEGGKKVIPPTVWRIH
jgi:hypothetical protein